MPIKRSFWTGRIKEIDGEKVKRGLLSAEVNRIGAKEIERGAVGREIKKVGEVQIQRSWWTGMVTGAPDDYYKAKLIDEDDARLHAPPSMRDRK
ncbi:MAG TPA: hypothetical protein VEW48_06345 [Thermoanaerobaculia bacterium]|nr:hypothetical protein [Thermoanaerobaculia bacterium]